MIKTSIAQLEDKYYKTDCSECEKVNYGTKEQYTKEMRNPNSQWACLSCGTREFVFDDDFHHNNMERIQILNLYYALDGQVNKELMIRLKHYFENRFEELMQSDGLEFNND